MHIDAPQPRALTYVREIRRGLGRFSPRKRSFTIERIYAYKTYAEKIHNLVILNMLLHPHDIVRINKKHYEFTRKKTRHQRRSLCVNHSHSIRCRHIIIIQSPKYPFCHKIYRYQKRDLYGGFQSSLIYTPDTGHRHRSPYIYSCLVPPPYMYQYRF